MALTRVALGGMGVFDVLARAGAGVGVALGYQLVQRPLVERFGFLRLVLRGYFVLSRLPAGDLPDLDANSIRP